MARPGGLGKTVTFHIESFEARSDISQKTTPISYTSLHRVFL